VFRRIVLAALALVLIVLVPTPAQAAPKLDDAVAALKNSRVYVAPGTEGTDADTAAILAEQLNDDDNIAIVMLPVSAIQMNLNPDSAEAEAVAARLAEATNHQYTLGVAFGNDSTKVAATSKLLPTGVASTLMKRAITNSTNNQETVVTFIRYVHSWQTQNPEAVKKPPKPNPAPVAEPAEEGGVSWGIIGLIVVCVLFALALGLRAITLVVDKSDGQRDGTERVKLRGPDRIRDELRSILDKRPAINDRDLRDTITQLVHDTEEVFRRLERNSPDQVNTSVVAFEQHLQSLIRVLDQYVDVQNNPRYFENPQKALQDGREAVAGFATYVLRSAQRAGRQQLTGFTVDTKILSAQRYS
jgi:hypothetical protein